ncbi:MAG: PAS domain S-box protein [Betaproteobacteria bacterium]
MEAVEGETTQRRLIEAIATQAPDAIIFADRGGAIRFWNDAAERLFGYTRAEAVGQSLDLIIPERLRRAHWDGFDKALATGVTKYSGKAMTTRSMHRNGDKIYVDLSFGLVRDASGALIGATAIGRDCTERQLARAAAAAAPTTA